MTESDPRQMRGKLAESGASPFFVLEDQGRIRGVLTEEMAYRALRRAPPPASLGEAASPKYEVVSENATLFEIVSRMHANQTEIFIVSANQPSGSANEIRGWISKERIADPARIGTGV